MALNGKEEFMKLGLLAKMLLLILVPVLVGTIALTGISYYMGDEMIRKQIDSDSRVVIDTAATGIDAVFTGLHEGILPITLNRRLVDLMTAYAESGPTGPTPTQLEAGHEIAQNFVKSSELVNGSYIMARDGYTLAAEVLGQDVRAEVGTNRGNLPYFKEAIQTGRMAVQTIFLPEGPMTVMAVPVIDNGRLLGVITARLRNSAISVATSDKVVIGRTGRTFAYDMQGRVVLAPNKARLGRDESHLRHVQEMLSTRTGALNYQHESDDKFLYFKEVPNEHWILCVEVDSAEILHPTKVLFRNLIIVAVVIALVIGGIIFFAARILATTAAGLAGIADSVAGGHLEATPTEERFLENTVRRGDEFSVLAAAMRTMMSSLKKLMHESEEKARLAEEATAKAEEATGVAEEAAKRAENAKREGMLAAAHRLDDMVIAITSAAGQLSAQIEQSDRSAVESSERLQEAATAMNEMNATVQ